MSHHTPSDRDVTTPALITTERGNPVLFVVGLVAFPIIFILGLIILAFTLSGQFS